MAYVTFRVKRRRYNEVARTEFRGAGLKSGDTVLFLGSGPLPLSLIVLCQKYGLKGIGIEQEPDRAELSRRAIEKLGLLDQIRIIKENHLTLPIEEPVDRIMVAAQAEPKDVIFDHRAKVMPIGTKMSCRIYEKGLRRLLDTFSRYELPANLKECLRIRPTPLPTTHPSFCRSFALSGAFRSAGGGDLTAECKADTPPLRTSTPSAVIILTMTHRIAIGRPLNILE